MRTSGRGRRGGSLPVLYYAKMLAGQGKQSRFSRMRGCMAGRLADYMSQQVRFLPLSDMDISEFNVRRREITADLDELANSLDRYGLQQPIVVAPKGDRFEILVGQRRYLAAKQLGWEEIPALLLSQPLDRIEATIFSFSENIQRHDLSGRDKAAACKYLLDALGSIGAVAEQTGVSTQTVRKWLGYAAVPEAVKDLVAPGGLTMQQAIRISQNVDDHQTATDIALRVAKTPVKADRERVLESVTELPGRSVETIFRRAEEKKDTKEIHFILHESSARAIDEAAKEQSTEPDEIAMSATIQWLQDNKYLR